MKVICFDDNKIIRDQLRIIKWIIIFNKYICINKYKWMNHIHTWNTLYDIMCKITYTKFISHDFRHTNESKINVWNPHDMDLNNWIIIS